MTTAEATPVEKNGSAAVNAALSRYADAKGWRRGVRRLLGPDVDPEYCFADFLWRAATGDAAGLEKVYGAAVTKAPLGVSAGGATGGYLVPPELRYDLMQDVGEEAFFRPRANVVPMTSSLLKLPLPDAATAQAAGTSPFFGGIKLSWVQEQQTRPETEPAWRQVELRAWELTGYALLSNNLAADGGDGLERYLRRLFARAIAWYEDFAYFQGDGVGKPQGLVGCTGAKTVTRQTGSQFTQQDVYKMSQALLPASWARAVWVVSPSLWEWLTKLGSTQWQINLPMDPRQGDAQFVLEGRPGFVTEKLPAVGTRGDVIFFDPSLYVIGDRGAVEVAVSADEPTAWKNNQSVWRVTYRGDGQPQFSQTITLQDAATTVSPYVVLV